MRRATALALLALAGCGSSGKPSSPTVTGPAASCSRPSPISVGSQGPEITGRGSNYHRPGDEWGSGYRFLRPGCYRLTARRTVGSAEAWLRVRA
jgi:hypothetical protein